MTNKASLIFPHQLYRDHPALEKGVKAYLLEDPLFFGDAAYPLAFHKKKLVLHRASMQAYLHEKERDFPLEYIEHRHAACRAVFSRLAKNQVRTVLVVEPDDFLLKKRIAKHAEEHGMALQWKKNPNFLTEPSVYRTFFGKKKRYHQTDFYIWQRKRLGIMLDGDQPQGGKWTYDTENRKKLPKGLQPPPITSFGDNRFLKEAKAYVAEHFAANPGELDGFIFPVDSVQAEWMLEDFLAKRFASFGPFQDAVCQDDSVLFHSLLSSSLNIGLLQPDAVVKKCLDYGARHAIPLQSLEGFIRQVVGWREFMRALYDLEGVPIRNSNFFNCKRRLSRKWYTGDLGILPVDHTIRRLIKTAYAHHIERLMVLGGFMLLCEIDPEEVYRWFMELFIDSYDWVMVPNVYAMSQYADGGGLVTKPYISSSNYIRKMSDYPAGEWCAVWDGLYWRFLMVHRAKLEGNPRMAMMYKVLEKKSKDDLKRHMECAEEFLAQL